MAPTSWNAGLLLILCAVVSATQEPILAFSFDGTTTSDDGGTTLTPQGTGFSYVAGVGGGQAASFLLGGSVYLTSQPLAFLPSGNAPRSVSLWIMPTLAPTASFGYSILGWGGDLNTGPACSNYWLTWANNAGWSPGYNGISLDAGYIASFSQFDLTLNNWQHIVLVYDGTSTFFLCQRCSRLFIIHSQLLRPLFLFNQY